MKKLCCILLMFSLLLCGCGVEQPSGTLSVCVDGNGLNEMFLGPILAQFQHDYPEIMLEITYLPAYKADDPAMVEARGAAFTRTRTELMSGKGADVYLFLGACGSGSATDSYMLFPDLERNIRSGVLHDLDFLFEQEAFQREDYVNGICDTGVWEGKSYMLPLSYQIFGLVGVDAAMGASGFDPAETDPVQFTASLLKLGDLCPQLSMYAPTLVLNSVATPPVSVRESRILLDSHPWQQALELGRDIVAAQGGAQEDFTAFVNYTAAAQAGVALLPGASFSMCAHSLRVLEDAGHTARFVPFPNETGGVTAQPYVTAVVSAGCGDLDAAAQLLLWLLSEPVQGCGELGYVGARANLAFIGFSWPVRRGSAREMLEQLRIWPVEPGTISETLAADLERLEDRIDTFRILSRYDASLPTLVDGYLKGAQSWEDCWTGIADAWDYLDE